MNVSSRFDGGSPRFYIDWSFHLTSMFYNFVVTFLTFGLSSKVQKFKDLPLCAPLAAHIPKICLFKVTDPPPHTHTHSIPISQTISHPRTRRFIFN